MGLSPATADPMQDPVKAQQLLQQYADEDKLIDTQKAIELFNNPDMIAKSSFYEDGLTIVTDPSLNIGLRMLAALSGSYQGGEVIREYLLSKTAAGLPVVAGIVFRDSISKGGNAEVLYNHQTLQVLIAFSSHLMHEDPFLLLPIFFHEIAGHVDGTPGLNEERAANILENIVMYHQILEHSALYANARLNALTELETLQLLQFISMVNSLHGEDTIKGPNVHITEANSRVYPNAQTTYPMGRITNFISQVDMAQGYKNWEEQGLRLQQSGGWQVVASCGHTLAAKASIFPRTIPEGGTTTSNRYYDNFLQKVFGINTGGSTTSFSNFKTKHLADQLYEASRQSAWFNAANRLKVMETVGLEAPADANPLP